MAQPVLYFHGFASSPRSRKVQLLRELLSPGIELNTPDLNAPSFEKLDWNAIVERAVAAGTPHAPTVIAGSSLGSVVALEVVRRGILAPLVLTAPALGIADRWPTWIPEGDPVLVYNHARGADVPIHRAFFDQITAVDVERHTPPVPVTVIMGTADESVRFECVSGVWRAWERSGALPPGSHFVAIEGGDHGLIDHVSVIAREIRSAAAQARSR